MYKGFLCFLIIIVPSGSLFAREIMTVEKHLMKVIKEEVQKECASCQVQLDVHNKKVIEDIAIPDQVIADRWKGQTNLLLKMDGENRLVTVTIRWKDRVVVAKKNIKQGHLMQASDLRVVEKDVTYLKTSYLQEIKDVVGWTGRRIFQRGQIIDEDLLKKPIVVRYGQPIQLQLNDGALQLSMMGKARGAGAIGDRIPVFIANTRKKVFAEIIDKNTARLE